MSCDSCSIAVYCAHDVTGICVAEAWKDRRIGGIMTNEERQKKVRWLMRYRLAKKRIERSEAEQERWRDQATKTTTTPTYFKYFKERENLTLEQKRRNAMSPIVIRGGKHLTLEDIIGEIDVLDREIQVNIYKSTVLRRDIGKAIEALEDDREQLVLYYKYVDGMYLEEICVRMGYSYAWVKKLHNQGVANIKMKE